MKNFVNEGRVVTMTAPAGGVVGGTPVKIGALVLIPMDTVAAGNKFQGRTEGVYLLPVATGLTAGALVKWDSATGKLVSDTTKDTDDFGHLITDESGGYAEARLSN